MVDHDTCYTDDETERKKKKKTRVLGEEVGLAPGSRTSYGFENVDRLKKIIGTTQPDRSYTSKDNPVGDVKVVRMRIVFRQVYNWFIYFLWVQHLRRLIIMILFSYAH